MSILFHESRIPIQHIHCSIRNQFEEFLQALNMSSEFYLRNIVENFEKLVQAIHEVGDDNQKELLSQKFESLVTSMTLIEPPTKKRPLDFENTEKTAKKRKILTPKQNLDLPNELWLKIFRYLRTWDDLLIISRLNKRFNKLACDPSALSSLYVNAGVSRVYQNRLKILKRCNKLNTFEIRLLGNDDQFGWEQFMKEILIKGKNLRCLIFRFSIEVNFLYKPCLEFCEPPIDLSKEFEIDKEVRMKRLCIFRYFSSTNFRQIFV